METEEAEKFFKKPLETSKIIIKQDPKSDGDNVCEKTFPWMSTSEKIKAGDNNPPDRKERR